jgi:putative RNA 2'-phosphotransferase
MTTLGMNVNLEIIKEVVEKCDKQRFTISEDFNLIRANQGHSIDINLGLQPINPPNLLFHGTAERDLKSILKYGIKKGDRQQVHLSKDRMTALKVGQRHGKSIIFLIDSFGMSQDGLQFFQSENGVWLTDYIAPVYFTIEK